MDTMMNGTRIDVDAGERTCVVAASPSGPRLTAAAVTTREGKAPEICVVPGHGPWRLALPDDAAASTTVLLYMANDTEVGRVEDRGPITCVVGSTGFTLATLPDKHGAVILAQIYTRNGRRLMRVRGDGYAFGIKAFARKEGLDVETFIPRETPRNPRPDHSGDARPHGGQATGSGSGVIVARDHVVTNAHVVAGGRGWTVHGSEGDVGARLVCVDEQHDLALLRVPNIGGTPLIIRGAGTLFLGEPVITAGYPLRDMLGDDLKMTHGNVSGMKGLGGSVSSFQFSAPIGSGSSGGAVTDQSGNLVGIVTSSLPHEALRRRGAVSENMNFAVKASLVCEMLAAHEVDCQRDPSATAGAAEVARRIRQGVVAITVMD